LVVYYGLFGVGFLEVGEEFSDDFDG